MNSTGLTKETILKALQELSEVLALRNVKGEICLFCGAVMMLAYVGRVSTKDVDALFQPSQAIRDAALEIAEANGLPADWLNDGVKGFVSAKHDVIEGDLPQFPNLALTMPTPEYLLAMKCLASRIEVEGTGTSDVQYIILLIRRLELKTPSAVMELVTRYYRPNQIPIKAQYLVESLFEEGRV